MRMAILRGKRTTLAWRRVVIFFRSDGPCANHMQLTPER